MAKIEVNKVELVWPGKYNDDGTLKEVPRVKLPFQVIERVNESRATREANKRPSQLSLFETWQANEGETFEDGWRNKLIWGDNLLVMSSLLEKFAGKIDLIYIDPPFATGADFSFTAEIGDHRVDLEKEQSAIEEKVYRDTWGQGAESYISMMRDRLVLMRDLLSEHASIYVHLDPRIEYYIRTLLDEAFGVGNFRNLVIWKRDFAGRGAKSVARQWPRNADTLLFYTKSMQSWQFDQIYVELSENQLSQYDREDPDGRRFKLARLGDYTADSIRKMEEQGLIWESSTGTRYKKYYLDEATAIVDCIWTDIMGVGTFHALREAVGFPTQKPESLLDRITRASSKPGDIVADLFCGSGTSLAVAERLGRRWIGCDLSRFAIHTTRKRLLEIEGCKPFEVLNLGKYERQYWQGVTFHKKGKPEQRELYEYLAFILRLYVAQPVSGMQHLHGKKGRALVHIGAVDAPVTIDEVNAAIDECLALKQTDLHVLGWEWEMGMAGLMEPEAKHRGVRLSLLQIPREVMEQRAAEKGDVQFFQLAYLEVEINDTKKLSSQVALTGFVISNTELIPEDVREKVKKWSDWVDYWAVDWDFQNDTFMQGWVAYRTRKERALPLKSDGHRYAKAGKYTIVVKVIDIFGNDTTQAFEHTVK